MFERLTEFHNGIWGMSIQAVKKGFDKYSVFSRLAAYEDSKLSPEEVQELAKAKSEGRLVVLPCKGEELREKYRALTSPTGDGVQTYTTGYRNGHRNGQAELIAYLLQIDLGTREAAENALGGAES